MPLGWAVWWIFLEGRLGSYANVPSLVSQKVVAKPEHSANVGGWLKGGEVISSKSVRTTLLAIMMACLLGGLSASPSVHANALVALHGMVRSGDEGSLEGVLVSATKDGSTITRSVVSDVDGNYSFLTGQLEPGHYTLAIRATGYDLDGAPSASVESGMVATADLVLIKAKDLASQLTNAEWMISAPGTAEEKSLLLNCVDCHTLNRPVESTHSADEFVQVLSRMATYAYNSQPIFPQRFQEVPTFDPEKRFRKMATYLSSINMSAGGARTYPLKPLPRIKGKGTHVAITEYTLPRVISQPHDVILDLDGKVWYTDFGQQFIGRLDPTSGAVKEFPLPVLKPAAPIGELDIESAPDGSLWVGMHYQGALLRVDPKSEKFRVYPLSSTLQVPNIQTSMVAPKHAMVDGRVWTSYSAKAVARLDLKSGKFETIYPFGAVTASAITPVEAPSAKFVLAEGAGPKPENVAHVMYGLATDRHNNLFTLDFVGQSVFKIDAKTNAVTEYPTSTLYSRPRRGHMDSQDRLWFAEFNANRIGMLDTKTGKMKEWVLPTEWTAPYDVEIDRNGDAWTAGETTDRVVRVNTKTGEITEYPLPRSTNIRRMFVDNRTNPVSVWIGNNHGPSIIKLEPRD